MTNLLRTTRAKYRNTRERCGELDIHTPRFTTDICEYCGQPLEQDKDGRWRVSQAKKWRPARDL